MQVKFVIIAWGFQAVQSKVFLELHDLHVPYLSVKVLVIRMIRRLQIRIPVIALYITTILDLL